MIYLDYAATTPLHPEILSGYHELLSTYFYNADSMYDKGIEVNQLMEKSRELLGQMLHVKTEELLFTSCGSEANCMAIKGVAFQYRNRGKHIITSCIEHSSVHETCKELQEIFGYEITYLSVDHQGKISLQELENSIRDDTILVTVMAINNEIGVLNPIDQIKSIVKKHSKIKLHFDMVQALAKIPIDLTDIDLASFSAHKINGLKGSGLLYKNKAVSLVPLINGGQQEFGLRGGTSNACTNIILAKTLRIALEDTEKKYQKVKDLNIYLKKQLLTLDNIVINSHETCCVPHVVNFSCVGYKPEVILHDLEAKGIYISTRSACSSKSTTISRVMEQLHLDESVASSALRVSLSYSLSYEDIDEFIFCLQSTLKTIKKQR